MMTVYLVYEPRGGHAALVCKECGLRPLLSTQYIQLGDEFAGLPPRVCYHVGQAATGYRPGEGKMAEPEREFLLKIPKYNNDGDLIE